MYVLIAEGMHKDGVAQLETAGLHIVTPREEYDPKQIAILIVRSVFNVDEYALDKYPNVETVAKLGTGLDNIDQEVCRSRGVAIIHAPGLNSVSTAEFAVAQIINIYKNSFEIYDRVRRRDFRRHLYYGKELADLSAGVIGYGSVGKNIVERLRPFVRRVYIRDKYAKGGIDMGNVSFVDDQALLLKNSDIVVLAVTLKGNEGMVDQNFLDALKDDCLLVNIARGGLVDEAVLLGTLKTRPRMRYFCDVLSKEPNYDMPPEAQDYTHPLLELPNVIFTPHIANLTDECQRKIALHIAQKVIERVPVASATRARTL